MWVCFLIPIFSSFVSALHFSRSAMSSPSSLVQGLSSIRGGGPDDAAIDLSGDDEDPDDGGMQFFQFLYSSAFYRW